MQGERGVARREVGIKGRRCDLDRVASRHNLEVGVGGGSKGGCARGVVRGGARSELG